MCPRREHAHESHPLSHLGFISMGLLCRTAVRELPLSQLALRDWCTTSLQNGTGGYGGSELRTFREGRAAASGGHGALYLRGGADAVLRFPGRSGAHGGVTRPNQEGGAAFHGKAYLRPVLGATVELCLCPDWHLLCLQSLIGTTLCGTNIQPPAALVAPAHSAKVVNRARGPKRLRIRRCMCNPAYPSHHIFLVLPLTTVD